MRAARALNLGVCTLEKGQEISSVRWGDEVGAAGRQLGGQVLAPALPEARSVELSEAAAPGDRLT